MPEMKSCAHGSKPTHTFIKMQSAMEYLMTYGWAILIIAIVLAALFQLGVFNANNFAPKALPGACQVFRPNGPGTTQFINFEGVCNGEMPEYVGLFNSSTTLVPSGAGYSSSTHITATTAISGSNYPLTITMWVEIPKLLTNSSAPWETFFGFNNYQAFAFLVGFIGLHRCTVADTRVSLPGTTNYNIWHFVAVSFNPATDNYLFQIDSNQTNITNTNGWSSSNNIVIGGVYQYCSDAPFVGYISNVQLYNSPLSSAELQSLHSEGIGGVPINLQSLVGWWPLNGNANDYSGNGNNGVPTNVIYVSNWYSGYTPP